ncbi:MAG: hypothetical protein HKN87_14640 [Saprospiraceae bacterium]|nr:hypothetical protein [Saprospiraceae bacterium]
MKNLIVSLASILVTGLFFAWTPLTQSASSSPTTSEEDYYFANRDDIVAGGIRKLTAQERSAFLSLLSDANMYKSVREKDWAKHRKKIMESLKKLQERMKGVRWMGPNGETYGSYSEYLEGAWGVPYPSEGNPYDPFR